jgi:tRNA(Ile)-lysidine synthase
VTLPEQFRRHLATLGLTPGRALVAVSGGPDSVALLDLLHATRESHQLELIVAHFDHGIHPESAAVAERVGELAASYDLACESGRAELGAAASETVARAARYAWLDATRRRRGAAIVLTGHHADDQAETILMRVLRGSGPAGLAAMATRRGTLVRPLLPFTRTALGAYVNTRGLSAWCDPANEDRRHLRAWIRTDVLPTLRARLPDVEASLRAAGRHAARDRAAWEAVLRLLPGLDFRREGDGFSVAAGALRGYDSALGETVVLVAARRVGYRLGSARAARVLDLAVRGVSGRSVPLGDGWRAEVAFGRILVCRTTEVPPVSWALDSAAGEGCWGAWRLRWSVEPAPVRQERAGVTAWLSPAPLEVRAWRPGERIRPLGGAGQRLLVRCFQDARVPRSRRTAWPVVAGPDGAVWVPGVCRSDALLPEPGTEAVRVDADYA